MYSLKKISVTLFCSSMLVACGTPPKREAPLSAEQLARMQLQPHVSVANRTSSASSPIAELPRSQHQPLKEVNQTGQVPRVTTMTDKTLDLSHVDLSDDTPIQLDFEQVALREIIEIIADALDISIVIDPTIANKVTIRTADDKPLKKKDLWPLLQLLLNDAGVTIEKRGGVYHLKKVASKLPNTIGITPKTLTRSDSPEVLQITPLRYISADSAKTVINPLIQPKGRVITLPTLNVIGIMTTPSRLARVNKLLSIIDADPFLHRGMRLFRLVNSKATDVQADLDKILKALYGKTQPTYQVIALERINAIVVIAPPNTGFNEVALWVDVLDEKAEDSGEQVFIYNVKNLEASKLASTLSSVFKLEDKKAAAERKKRERNKQKAPPKTKPTAPGGKLPVSAEIEVTIVADESTNSLLIRASPRDYLQLLETIYALDQVPKEVMVNMVIAEVSLTKDTQFGIDWRALFKNGTSSVGSNLSVPSGNFPAGVTPGNDSDVTQVGGLTGFSLNYLSGSLNALLNFVASKSDISILSRPSLLVRNNEEASINVGSNEPFLSGVNTSSYSNQQLSQDVQYKDTGITVKVTPRINDDGIINMKIFQELTLLGPTRTTQNLQSFDQRKIETYVVVRDGTAIVIGGLIQVNSNNDKNGIPVLQDLPLVGTLFSSTKNSEKRTELVLIIVPEIVNPEADNRPLVLEFMRRMQQVSQLLNREKILVEVPPLPSPTP
ncbi:MAG TPA: type II secretion system protein GspD [Thioploca sp.]|nr:type II secretion system protein GspD [Thioploca sp.]